MGGWGGGCGSAAGQAEARGGVAGSSGGAGVGPAGVGGGGREGVRVHVGVHVGWEVAPGMRLRGGGVWVVEEGGIGGEGSALVSVMGGEGGVRVAVRIGMGVHTMHLRLRVCLCMRLHLHLRVCLHLRLCVRMCMCLRLHLHLRICVCLRMCMCMRMCLGHRMVMCIRQLLRLQLRWRPLHYPIGIHRHTTGVVHVVARVGVALQGVHGLMICPAICGLHGCWWRRITGHLGSGGEVRGGAEGWGSAGVLHRRGEGVACACACAWQGRGWLGGAVVARRVGGCSG